MAPLLSPEGRVFGDEADKLIQIRRILTATPFKIETVIVSPAPLIWRSPSSFPRLPQEETPLKSGLTLHHELQNMPMQLTPHR